MKKRSLLSIIMVIMLASALFTACGGKGSSSEGGNAGTDTLENYAKNNKEVQESIDKATSDSDVEVSIKGNEVTYSYELSKMDGFTEDVAKDESVVKSLQTALDNAGPTFGGIAKTLEEATGIKGIKVTVNYTYGDDVIATMTYTSADASKGSTSSEGSAEDSSEGTDTEEASEEGAETDSAE